MPANLFCPTYVISIHAPREGCDRALGEQPVGRQGISIHAPREGCDIFCASSFIRTVISIHAPREGCDFCTYARFPIILYFNPRTPRGVRPQQLRIHSTTFLFQSTHPARGATRIAFSCLRSHYISIHAPREGCDLRLRLSASTLLRFQSTHPARGATTHLFHLSIYFLFQSTHPARGATANFTKEQGVCLAQFAYLHKGKKAEHTKTNAPMLH